MLVGNRIPKDFFVTTGTGESDLTIHAGSYHLALKNAGIEMCNIMTYSSILPNIATLVKNLDAASTNAAANGDSGVSYDFEIVETEQA